MPAGLSASCGPARAAERMREPDAGIWMSFSAVNKAQFEVKLGRCSGKIEHVFVSTR